MIRLVIAGSEVFTVGMPHTPLFKLDGRFNAYASKRPDPETIEIHGIGGWIAYHFTY